MKLKGAEGIARVFFCMVIGKEIIILHSIIKKQQKLPLKDLKTAYQRMKEIKNEQ